MDFLGRRRTGLRILLLVPVGGVALGEPWGGAKVDTVIRRRRAGELEQRKEIINVKTFWPIFCLTTVNKVNYHIMELMNDTNQMGK